MRFFDFCAGIGAGRLGLVQSGMDGVGYSEINKSAIKTYGIMHDASDEINYGNLTKLSPESLPEFDVLIAGFPCQTFSVIGKGAGFKDERGQIIFHLRDILSDRKTPYFILENVKGLTTHDSGKSIAKIVKSLEDIGYYVDYKVLSSLSFGVPQMRQRVYFVGIRKDLVKSRIKFEWPNPTKTVTLSDVLIDCDNAITETNLKYLNEYLVNKTNQSKISLNEILRQEYVVVDTRQSDLRLYYNRVPTLRSSRDGIYYVRNGLLRELTGYEALLLQGFPVDYANRVKHVVLNRDLLRQAGNAMTVTVIHAIGNSLLSYVKDISKVDENIIERKSMINTIVGVVKSREQYNHCFENMCYYTYANKINACIKDIEYISIYQPKTSFGEDNAGVYVYGKVTKVSEIYRDEISFGVNNANRKKKCILFEIKSWKKLKLPILPSGNAKIILETTFEKLLNANIYMDLT